MTGPTVSLRAALERQMETQDEHLPSSMAREQGLVWLEGWFDLAAALAQPAPPTEAMVPAHQFHAFAVAMLAEVNAAGGDMLKALQIAAQAGISTEATPPHDGLRSALRSIAEGNLGDLPWQANYERIRQVAAAALNSEVQPAGLGYAEGRIAGEDPWVPKLGDPVKVREGSDWTSDWQRIELWVAGVSVDERGRGVNVTVAEQWPVPMRHSRDYRGLTDDFIVARSDGRPNDLEPDTAIRTLANGEPT